MNRKLILILAFLLLIVCLGYPRFQQNSVRASDGYPVHNLNTGLNYTTIQEAINANETLDGHTIHVDAGTYYTNDFTYNLINKSVSLVGDGMENTTIIARSPSGSGKGAVFYVVSDYVNISGFTMQNGSEGVSAQANYVHITNCNISDNDIGISIYDSRYLGPMLIGEIIDGNILTNNTYAMSLVIDNSTICHNLVSDNYAGIYLTPGSGPQDFATNNLVYENTITNSSSRQPPLRAALSIGGENNTIFLNNILDTDIQAFGANAWDVRLNPDDLLWGGNFWSDNNETNKYGMGVVPYVIDSSNIDNHPLTGMLNIFDAPYGYEVAIISNSSISDFEFNLANQSQAVLTFNVAGKNETLGFCKVLVPQALINYSRTWVVKLDGKVWTTHEYSIASNDTYWNFWIDYPHSIHQIEIAGVATIPEFPTFLIPSLLMIAALLAIIVYKRKHLT